MTWVGSLQIKKISMLLEQKRPLFLRQWRRRGSNPRPAISP